MRRLVLPPAVLSLLSFAATAAADVNVYVSPAGNDAWTGSLAEPNAAKTDGPLATLDAARLKVREVRKQRPDLKEPVNVLLRGGTYHLSQPLNLSPEDGGTQASPTVYAASDKEPAVISGGTPVTGWAVGPDGRWTVTLPDVKAGKWDFAQLYVNGERRMRPRLPKQGYHRIAGRVPPPEDPKAPKGRGKADDRFRFGGDDIAAGWRNRGDVEVVTFHPWFTSMLRIADVEAADRLVTFTGGTRAASAWGQLTPGMRYLVENVAEALTEPGEWYLDRPTGVLTYIPMPGERPEAATVVAPRLDKLVVIAGAADGKGPAVDRVSFHGLTFAHTGWVTPATGSSISQAAVTVPAAVTTTGSSNFAVAGCTFTQLGGYGLEIGPGSRHATVEGCRFVDLGGGGVKVGSTGQPAADDGLAREVTVRECEIAHAGRTHPAAVGVWVGHAADVTVARNDIYDLYYTGVSAGWTWGYAKTRNKNIVIESNHIHHVGQTVLSDMGGVYTLGMSPGSKIVGNRMHDITRDKYGGWGVYYDEGSDGWVAERNLLYRLQDGGFHQHYGTNNVFRNNVILDSGEVAWGPTRIDVPTDPGKPRPGVAFTFERNVIAGWGAKSVVRGEATGKLFEQNPDRLAVDRNVYWNGGAEPRFGKLSMAEWQKWGHDKASTVLDPKLGSPDAVPFVLSADSPAAKAGLEPFELGKTGRTNGGAADLDPKRWPRWFPPATVAVPQAIRDGFEGTPVGHTAEGAVSSEEPPAGTARVTDEVAIEGKRSLKFTDAKGLKAGYDPHIYYQPQGYKSGEATARFAIRTEGGATLAHEWRGAGHPYAVGPSVQLAGDGTLRAGKTVLAKVPKGEWVRVELRCKLGGKAEGKFDAVVTVAGGQPQRFEGLPCGTDFVELSWFGFMSVSDRGTSYLDDLTLEGK
ncbi:MAG TPA: right-handed parallel beta-helix repeat-containing protein [Humisphaera sp.]